MPPRTALSSNHGSTHPARSGARPPAVRHKLAEWAMSRVAAAYGWPPLTIELWDGLTVYTPPSPPVARVKIRDWSVIRGALFNPQLALGDGYASGKIECEGDLVALLEESFRSAGRAPAWARLWTRIASMRLPQTSRQAARENIHHHYDVGNEFYRLWLDERMIYTCAYFDRPERGLDAAQVAKLDHVCRKLDLRPGERVIEAGCGWGALALHMAERYGVSVRAYNISKEQVRLARETAQRRGLGDRVEFVDDDWRSASGEYDAFVSVGMLEHVGKKNYRELGRVIDRCLAAHGRGLIHSIGRARPTPMDSWLSRRIFPGSYIPSLGEMMAVFEPSSLAVLDVENLRPHYARTLELWLQRFEASADRIREMYDEPFVRSWRLYLASSIASFRTGWCQLYQIVFSRAAGDTLPWTRAHVYRDPA